MNQQKALNNYTEKLGNQHWRLNNLYKIRSTDGQAIQFKMNWAQEEFYKNLHYFNVVLKARQLGFSTFILIYILDCCLFNSQQSAGVIAHTKDDAQELFKNKVKFAYDNLADDIREAIPASSDSARKLEFANGSSIVVGTSLRSGTFQKLHISEYGKIAARYPEKAIEIKTGALNTVHSGQQIFVESTAEGRQGEYFDLCEIARKLKDGGKRLTPLDPAFHFFAWWRCPEYELGEEDCAGTSINLEMQDYFRKLSTQGINLKPGQKAWYIKKAAIQGDKMKREYPSTPEEAFEASLEGAYYTKEMEIVRRKKQIGFFPHEPSKKVMTFWDIGKGRDAMAIWFFQHIGNEYRFIHYHESSDEGWGFYANYLKSLTGYVYGNHYWPHDGGHKVQGVVLKTHKQIAEELGIYPIKIVKRADDVAGDYGEIQTKCRPVLPRCCFDEVGCSQGIKHLDNYRKRWNESLGEWDDAARHDASSHCADAFRTFAVGYEGRRDEIRDDFDCGYNPRNQIADTEYNMFG